MKGKRLHKFTLDNGMRVVFMRNSAAPTVSFIFKLAVGSANVDIGKEGLSSVAASLLTKGTVKKSTAEIADAIDGLGMDVSFSSGNHTSSLTGRTLAEKLPQSLKLVRELLSESKPGMDELERMRNRIITGIRMRLDDPATVATDAMMQMIYGPEHIYGRPVSLPLQTLPSLTIDDVHDFYRTHFFPGSILAVIVGDYQEEKLEKEMSRAFGSWEGAGSFEIRGAEAVNWHKSPQEKNINIPGKTQSDIALGFQFIRRSDLDFYGLLAGNTAMGKLSMGGRIGQIIREREGLAYYAYTTFDAGLGAGPFYFRAGVDPSATAKAIELAIAELNNIRENGISPDDLEDSQHYLAGSMSRQVETNGGMGITLLNQEIYGLGDDYYLRFPDIIRNLTLDQVNEALNKHLKLEGYCVAIAGSGG